MSAHAHRPAASRRTARASVRTPEDPARAARPRGPRSAASLAALALAAAGLVAAAAPPALAADRTVALVGDLQSELGCPGDWQPECGATELAPTGTPGLYAAD